MAREAAMSKFGNSIREARTELGMSLDDLATVIGVSKVYICDVERGLRKPFTQRRIPLVAKTLNLDPVELAKHAAIERGYVELTVVKQKPSKARLAAALSHGWDAIDEDAVNKLMGAL